MTAPLTEALLAALAAVDAAVERCLAVAALLPGDCSPEERRDAARVAVEEYEALDGAVEVLLPVVAAQRPRGSYDVLEQAAARAWARLEATAGRVLQGATDAERRAADRAQQVAMHAYQRAAERYGRVADWVAAAVLERIERRHKDAA